MPQQIEKEDLAVSQRHAGPGEGEGAGKHAGQYLQRKLRNKEASREQQQFKAAATGAG